jgi:transcriptional regulator with XRE-family HTH domain
MEFSGWLLNELRKRDMTQADLSRLSGITSGGVAHLINKSRKPNPESCAAIAKAFRLPIETVYRAANLLPSITPEDTEWEIWKEKLRQLSPADRERFLRMMEAELEYQHQQELLAAARKRGKTGPLPNLGG